MFLKNRGINIDTSLFDLKFNTPQNFAAYRQIELDNQRVQAFTQIEQVPYLSKRFALKRFLGLSEEEMAQNQKMWYHYVHRVGIILIRFYVNLYQLA